MSRPSRQLSHGGPLAGARRAVSVTASAALLVSLLATTAASTVLAGTCDNAAGIIPNGPYGTLFSYCADQTTRPADSTSFIRLAFNTPSLPSAEFVLIIQVVGGEFVGGTDDFGPSGTLSYPRTQIILTGGAATLPSAPGTPPDPGDQLWLASTTPGTATVTIGYSTGTFVPDSIQWFTFTAPQSTIVSTIYSANSILDASTGTTSGAARGSDDSTVTSTSATGAITLIYLQTRVRNIDNAIISSGATVTWAVTGPGYFAFSNCPLGAVGGGTNHLSAPALAPGGIAESCDIASTGAAGTATITTTIEYLGVTYALLDKMLTFVSSAHGDIVDLLSIVDGQQLGPGTSLHDKLVAALAYVDADQTAQACDTLRAFLNEVRAQSGKQLTRTDADVLMAAATQILSALAC